MTSEYSDVFSRFMLRVTDYGFAQLDENLADEMMVGWLHATLSRPYIRRLFSSLSSDDDVAEIEYELNNSIDEESDQDFVEEMLAEGMVVQWLRPQYRSVLNTQQVYSNSEQKYYSQSAHAAEIREMYEESKRGLRKMIRDRGIFSNSYLNNELQD